MDKHFLVIDNAKTSLRNVVKCTYVEFEVLCKTHKIRHAAAAAAKSLQLCPTLCDPIDGSPPGSPILGFSRQEHWSGLPFPSPTDFPGGSGGTESVYNAGDMGSSPGLGRSPGKGNDNPLQCSK